MCNNENFEKEKYSVIYTFLKIRKYVIHIFKCAILKISNLFHINFIYSEKRNNNKLDKKLETFSYTQV